MASEKTCFKCQETKPLADFYRHPMMADGHLNKCKECTKADVASHRSANTDSIREYERSRAGQPHRIALAMQIQKRWRETHPDRRAAHIALGNAIKSGRIQRLPCWVCGEKAEAHHPDYSQPLDVVWLCPLHHKQAHAITRSAA